MLASILLMDPDGLHLRHGAAPSLPEPYTRAIDGQEIGEAAGSCGTAAFRREAVYVSNIATDPLWARYKDLALPHDLHACWSVPILSGAGAVLGTFALYHRTPRAPTEGEKEIVTLLTRIAATAIERDVGRQQRELLAGELIHRVKNILSIVLSIARMTIRQGTVDANFKAFEERLIALSKAQGVLSQSNWSNIDARELLTMALTPFAADKSRFDIEGPPVFIPSRLTLPFALTLHELCTNAVKYGALSTDEGRVQITWEYSDVSGSRGKFLFRWSEVGGPPVRPPARHGFGSRMIQQIFPADVGGEATTDFRHEGLVFQVGIPVDQLTHRSPA
jgi:two-component sensor histidine kinase